MTEQNEVRHETVFRKRWRDRQSAGARPGELIKQPRWIDAGLAALGVLLVAGGVAAATVTVERTASLAAVRQGESVTAIRSGGTPPDPGAAAQYRDASGTTLTVVIVEVTDTEVIARADRPGPASAGELVIPAGRQSLIGVLLPRLG